jgi:hypothetical protein
MTASSKQTSNESTNNHEGNLRQPHLQQYLQRATSTLLKM